MKIKVFIENEAASNQKNIFNEKKLEFMKKVQVSAEYPYPYGFILNTTGEDGDNIDCFVLTDQQLRTGDIIECEPIGLMEQVETSWSPEKTELEENDHNVLACIDDELVEINKSVREKLEDFVSHVFDHMENKTIKVGSFLGSQSALDYITTHMD
ncbi:MAG: inorganic diphosphatase [Candidatus Paceibacterota bacterium]